MGDRIGAETYFQYAEHYYRIVNVRPEPKPNGDGQTGRRGGNGHAEADVEAAPKVADEQPDAVPFNGEPPQEGPQAQEAPPAQEAPQAQERPAPQRRRRPRQAKAAEPSADPGADSKPDPRPKTQASPKVQARKDGEPVET